MKRIVKRTLSISDRVLYENIYTTIIDDEGNEVHSEKKHETYYGDDAYFIAEGEKMITEKTQVTDDFSGGKSETREEELSDKDAEKYSKPRYSLSLYQATRGIHIKVTDEWSDSYDKAYALETQKKSKRYLEQVNGDLNKLNGKIRYNYYGAHASISIKNL